MASVADDTTDKAAATSTNGGGAKKPRRRGPSAKTVARQAKAGTDAVRSRIASLVWIIAVVCAAILAIGALLVALDAVNESNPVVQWITDTAGTLAGPLGELFSFEKENSRTDQAKNALVNWGIAAVVYLLAGRILDRIIRP